MCASRETANLMSIRALLMLSLSCGSKLELPVSNPRATRAHAAYGLNMWTQSHSVPKSQR